MRDGLFSCLGCCSNLCLFTVFLNSGAEEKGKTKKAINQDTFWWVLLYFLLWAHSCQAEIDNPLSKHVLFVKRCRDFWYILLPSLESLDLFTSVDMKLNCKINFSASVRILALFGSFIFYPLHQSVHYSVILILSHAVLHEVHVDMIFQACLLCLMTVEWNTELCLFQLNVVCFSDPNGGPNGHIQGSFLCHLPTPIEISESPETSPSGSISSPPRPNSSYYKPPPPMYPYKSHAR